MDRDRDRPRILVTSWRRPLPTYLGERTLLDTLDPAYAERVFDAGGLPLVVSRPPGGAIDGLIELADGLLVTGGGDVDPVSYGERPDNVADEDWEADAFELALIKAARERALPTLAICRGAQLLAVAHGGRLAQRLSGAEGHEPLDGLAPEAILSARHPIEIAPGSRVERALGARTVAVNTIHHHEIADPGALEVTATAAGGVIEAVEPHTDWPCVGVQWHPEKMVEPEQAGLFAQLVSAARSEVVA
ncbi:MAG TPA: gamma-glutamyl-gamma-aminobutyrate hydrolase family protein [Solirubrobacteraceae bacterium]|nr:gamma-glutamyl-gamma-aminobutyrate hydrolase family protein [Solirubrobacteraceae bacterium]